ncbi:MAG: hypothetical protein K2M45_08250 [Muribaculaceae bacterium]|nr:hypothetical protein [Muribaculaceae bacterium]
MNVRLRPALRGSGTIPKLRGPGSSISGFGRYREVCFLFRSSPLRSFLPSLRSYLPRSRRLFPRFVRSILISPLHRSRLRLPSPAPVSGIDPYSSKGQTELLRRSVSHFSLSPFRLHNPSGAPAVSRP